MKYSLFAVGMFVLCSLFIFSGKRAFQVGVVELSRERFDVGAGQQNETRIVPISVSNSTPKVATVTGGSSNCVCVAIDSLPIKIPPGEQVLVPINVTFPKSVGKFEKNFVLAIHADNYLFVKGVLHGKVISDSER